MKINTDLHSHSGHSGGVGQIDIKKYLETLPLKGINVFGTGDCLHPEWNRYLKNSFIINEKTSLLEFNKESQKESETNPSFLLQTEIILTSPLQKTSKGRKGVHTLILFPNFESIEKTTQFLEKKGMKNTIGRPFIKCSSNNEVSDTLNHILDIDDTIEIIPAHVMTPQGVYGSINPINNMKDFYGESSERFSAVETGLSADPEILSLIPELDNMTLISNSDAHSHNLNRVGREFSELEMNSLSYENIINAIRNNNVTLTAEFNPTEGRYFLSGHSDAKSGHSKGEYCIFSPANTPKDHICPICNKKMTIGVLDRAFEIRDAQGGEDRKLGYLTKTRKPYKSLVPLIEIIAASTNTISISSKKVIDIYNTIIFLFGTEINLFTQDKKKVQQILTDNNISQNIITGISEILDNNFSFSPPGFDGTYGKLNLGIKEDFLNINTVKLSDNHTTTTNTLKDFI